VDTVSPGSLESVSVVGVDDVGTVMSPDVEAAWVDATVLVVSSLDAT
jgi:hypothetical protein